ncbi:TonB-dependent receptor plug domain-containing protein [Shimia sp.]|uniref:TonB-dependent receptor plug domain-containing protein n=1 Tax=Shimia sp. TaxID=1954381 RepID=UPI003B8E0F0C
MSVLRFGCRAQLMGSCFAAVLPATVSVAQDLEDGYYSLDTITIEAQDEQEGAADRATAVYVSGAELERARSGSVKDLFAGLANVSVGGAIPMAQKIFVNGVDMLNLTVQMDGILQNNRAFHHVSANVFDPGMLKFVRADPGIAAADTGPNAVAGAVIMETVDAADILTEGRSIGGDARLSFDSNGSTIGASATVAATSGNFEVLGYLRTSQGDDYKDGNGDIVEGTAANFESGLLKFAFDDHDQHRVEFSAQRINDSDMRPYRANIGDVPGRTPAPTRLYDTQRNNYSLRYEDTRNQGNWDPEVVIGFSESLVNVPDPFASEGDSSTLSGKVQNTFHLSPTNTIVAGVDFYDRQSTYRGTGSTTLTEKADNIGVFAQARFELGANWEISTGFRYDWQGFEGLDAASNSASSKSVNGASGNLSVRYHINEALSVRAGASNVFGGIQLEDNYLFELPAWDYSNLEASRANNYTLGFDWGNVRTKVGGEVFLTQIDNVRSGGDNFDFESKGWNLGLTHGWTNGSLRISLAHSEVERDGIGYGSWYLQDYGAPLGTVAALQVQQYLPQQNLLIGGGIDMALDYDKALVDSDVTLPGYTVFNVFAEYTPKTMENLTLRASINNLFDTQYADRATYGQDYSTVVPLAESGRSVMIEAIARF